MRGCDSPVVKVSDHGRHVMSSSSVPLKDPLCRGTMHVKSVKSSNILPNDDSQSLKECTIIETQGELESSTGDSIGGKLIGHLIFSSKVLSSHSVIGKRPMKPMGGYYREAMGPDYIFMDVNVRPHIAHIFDEFLEEQDICRMD
ncbi:hypothetical protein TNCV_1716831 [Trichonephila clavipes]|nr:hypothetical protein TNCV_1716831 [Trichonephila clavipes]